MSEAADVGADADLDLPRIVLDTNVILDGWVFGNPAWAPIGEALAAQQLQWVVCASMLDELRFVLARPQPVRFEAARQAVLLDTERWQQARVVPAPSSEDLPRLRCSDCLLHYLVGFGWIFFEPFFKALVGCFLDE